MSFKTELAELLKKYDAQVVSAYDGHFGLEVEFETKEDGEYKYPISKTMLLRILVTSWRRFDATIGYY